MIVKMKVSMASTDHPGREPGDEVDVTEDEGKRLIAAGFASKVEDKGGSKTGDSAGK